MLLQESLSGVYEMNEDPLNMVEKLIDYFYTADYDECVVSAGETEYGPVVSGFQVHTRMFALADKYDIEGLRILSVEKYSRRLKEASTSPKYQEFLESVPEVYDLPPPSARPLRNEVTHFARISLAKFLKGQSVREAYEKIAVDTPDFIKDVLDLYMEECFTCGSHQAMDARCRQCGRGISI
jgi:hypothetical protein